MNCSGRILLLAALTATPISRGFAQEAAYAAQPEDLHVKVEITMQKNDFTPSDKIGFRAILINQGTKAVYIARSWESSGGGIAGFHANVKQLSVPRPNGGCTTIGDRGIYTETRPAEQILREDFVLLSPNSFVGYDGALHDCGPMSIGTWEIKVEYDTTDWNMPKVVSLGDAEKGVLTGTIQSNPLVFRVHEAGKKSAERTKAGP